MFKVRHLVTVPISLLSFVYTIYAVGQLMWFLSVPNKIKKEYTWILNILDNPSRFEASLLPVTLDTLLIILFIFQHSLMRSDFLKSIWSKIGLSTIERSIYNIATSAALLVQCFVHSLILIKNRNVLRGRDSVAKSLMPFSSLSFPAFDSQLENRSDFQLVER